MKTLSFQQPWASLICSGIKDVENRTWKPAQIPGKILIHASSKKVPKRIEDQIPIEWAIEMNNARKLGTIPEYTDMPTSAIIGYVDVTGFADDTDSLWDGGEEHIKWILENAYLFDEPICDVKGKLNLFDYPLDENNLPPAHKVEPKNPHIEGTELVIPLSKVAFDEVMAQDEKYIPFEITDDICDALFEKETEEDPNKVEFRKMDTVRLECDGKRVRYGLNIVELCAYSYEDTQEQITYTTLRGEECNWNFVCLEFGEELK